MLADLSSLFDGASAENPKNAGAPWLRRCSISRDSMVLGYAPALRKPNEEYPVVGYVAIKLSSLDPPVDPANNWINRKSFINGIDSPTIGHFETVTRSMDGETISYFDVGRGTRQASHRSDQLSPSAASSLRIQPISSRSRARIERDVSRSDSP